MFEIGYVVVYLVTYFLNTLCLKRLLRIYSSVATTSWREWLGVILYYIVVTTTYLVFRLPILNFISSIIGLLFLSRIYEKRWKRNVFQVALIYLILILSECFGMITCQQIPETVFEQYAGVSELALVIQCIALSIIVQVYKKFEGLRRNNSLAWSSWTGVLTLQFLLIFLLIFLTGKLEKTYLISTTLMIAVANYIIVYIYDRLLVLEEEKRNHLLVKEQNKGYLMELEALMESQKKVRGVYHDLKNHVLVIRTYLQQMKYEELNNYLDGIQEQTVQAIPQVYTGQFTVDSMINYKMSVAQKNDIRMKVNATIPEKLSIDDFDLSVLLGNLLDNATEACNGVKDAERKIVLNLKVQGNQFFILAENNFFGELEWRNGLPVTKKQDRNNHGLGMQNIKRVVDKYNGILELNDCENIFRAKIMIYLG